MSERKVLNKYYPPDFDPSKIPRLHLPKDRQYTVRLMAPCNMRCKTCGEYIYKGKKFNARKETVQGEDYLGIKVFRFYIKCTRCLAEITFKTDPQNADYIVEHGATRNFQALKLAEEQAEREQKELEEEEASNPMKLLENRTKASKYEMEILEGLEELKDLNQRQANVDFEKLLQQNAELTKRVKVTQEEEDEALIKSVFGRDNDEPAEDGPLIKRLSDDDSDEELSEMKVSSKLLFKEKPSDILVDMDFKNVTSSVKRPNTVTTSSGLFTARKKLHTELVVRKKPETVNIQTTKKDLNPQLPEETTNKNLAPVLNLTNYSDSDSDSDES